MRMEIGSKWKDWTIESFIGEGSFGKVYKIVREEYGNRYESALKVIKIPHSTSEMMTFRNEGMSEKSVTSFYEGMVQDVTSELALMSRLRGNSNIVSYEDHTVVELEDEFGWEIYLRMELVMPMYKFLDTHDMTVADVVKMGMDICRALETCQQNHIIHRDIKPDNIFYSNQGTFKLGDFGIARTLDESTAGMSKKGTYTYMAPEVYKGQPYNSTVDLYSLGLVLYRFLNCNRGPFQPRYPEPIAYKNNEEANVKRMTGEQMEPPCHAEGKLGEIILKACAYDPASRYRTAQDMLLDLENILPECDDKTVVFPMRDADSSETVIEKHTAEEKSHEGETMILIGGDALQNQIEHEPVAAAKDVKINVSTPEEEKSESALEEKISETVPAKVINENVPEEKSPEVTKEPKKDEEKNKISKIPWKYIVAAVLVIGSIVGLLSYFNHTVPDITGKSAEAAEALLKKNGLKYEQESREFSDTVEKDAVISQSVDEGEKVRRGFTVSVVVSRGKAIKVADFTGSDFDKAKKKAKKSGLIIELDEDTPEEYSDTVAKGCIIKQSPESGKKCEEGTVIAVVKSKGKEQVKVPDTIGKTKDKANSLINEAKLTASFNMQYSNNVQKGHVISQTPEAGSKVDKNSTVIVYISNGTAPSGTGRSQTSTRRRKTSSRKSSGSKRKSSKKHGQGVGF